MSAAQLLPGDGRPAALRSVWPETGAPGDSAAPEPGDPAPMLLSARDLTVRFGKVTALDGLTLTAPAGRVLAVLGPNGAGKTTFIRAIATLIRPDGGELRVLGKDVVRNAASVRREIGLAGQYAAVEPAMTGRENLEMTARLFGHGRLAARRAAGAVIEQLSLGDVADRRCGTYSGGQRRRLDLGASLVGAPSLLLLDEPTTGLDPISRREVWDAVRGLAASGTGILLTTHYLEEADELADQVVVIDHGRAIAAGPLAELKASIGLDVIEAAVPDYSGLDQVAGVLHRVTGALPRLDAAGRRASVPSAGGPAELAAVIRQLVESGLQVDAIGLRRPTLDEVFGALTGQQRAEVQS
jgi:ABC-2 type transport system ATP-binding protein